MTIQVQVPNSDKSEWKLNGQMIAITLPLTEPISTLKSKLQDETGMPPAKQKIFYEVIYITIFIFTLIKKKLISCFHFQGMFFKDSNTMAFYNLVNGTTVHLQVKERGGRKK